jgi:hypothetical protein
MTDGPPGGNGFQIIQDILAGLPGDGRLRYTNYGKGVLLWQDDPWPAQWVNQYQHVVSTDLYWFTDPNQIGMVGPPWLPERGRQMALSEVRRAANYGYQIDRLRDLDARDGRRQPIWTLVEVGWPFVESAEQGGRAITAPEIRAAVWHSIIAGARGIVYFNHDFGGPCISQHVLRDTCGAAVRPTVKAVNRQIRTLAPVLNAPTVTSGWTAGSSIRAMVKWQGGRFYVLAGSRENRSSTGRFSMPCVGNAQAVRLGEAGSVPVMNGSFSDSFADGNAIHIYEIHGGSTCGLVPGRSGGGGPGGSSGRWVTRVGRVPRRVSLRSRRLRVPVTCAARCTVRSRLTTRYRSRRVLLSATVRRFGPGPHKVALLLTRQDRRRVADGRAMRLHTVIVQAASRVQRTQLIRARRR